MQVLSCKKEELYNRRDLELLMSLAPLKDQSFLKYLPEPSAIFEGTDTAALWSWEARPKRSESGKSLVIL